MRRLDGAMASPTAIPPANSGLQRTAAWTQADELQGLVDVGQAGDGNEAAAAEGLGEQSDVAS